MIKKFNLKSTIKNALFIGLGATIAAGPAGAQQTPQTYCVSLPATSCEVLNVELGGMSGAGIGLVKYCRNQMLMMAPVGLYSAASSWNNVQAYVWTYKGSSAYNISGGASGQTAWSNTALCNLLP